MKRLILVLAAFVQATSPDPKRFAFVRTVNIQPGDSPRACAPIDAAVYAHAAPGLVDLRLFSSGAEVPYALTLSNTPTASESAPILNLGMRDRKISFDLKMPERLYSRVHLDLGLDNFIATARVTGRNGLTEQGTLLGSFDLFDFSSEHLARNTTFALAESSFPYLHVELAFLSPANMQLGPAIVRAAIVPPSREAQTVFTTIAETPDIKLAGRESVATFHVPARVPVERVAFDLSPDPESGAPRDFSRSVHIRAKVDANPDAVQELLSGEISHLDRTDDGEKLRLDALSFPATVGSNAQSSATVEVAVENGDDRPLALRAVKLQMRERKICFDVPSGPLQMYYGDSTLASPQYDFGRVFNPAARVGDAILAPEAANPIYVPPSDMRSLTERHPRLLWLALLGAMTVLGVVAFRSAKRV